jgi:AmmeMemoRadiSam system protein A
MRFDISRAGRLFLLNTARKSIKNAQNGSVFSPDEIPQELMFKSGCFVTLNLRGRLRGCIGTFREDTDIVANVVEMARQAAFADPRFGPVSKDELGMCEIEISVLSPMIKCSAGDITVGRDGIYIIRGHKRGVLLPQVAVSQGWDRDTFLSQTCVKAGLDAGAWRDGSCDIYRFEALVFGDENTL